MFYLSCHTRVWHGTVFPAQRRPWLHNAADPLNRWCRRMPSEYLSLPLYLSVSPSLDFSPSLSISPSFSIYPPLFLSIHPSIYPSVSPSTYLSIQLSIYLSVYLSLSLYLSTSLHLSIHPSIHPSIHLSIYLSLSLSPQDPPNRRGRRHPGASPFYIPSPFDIIKRPRSAVPVMFQSFLLYHGFLGGV